MNNLRMAGTLDRAIILYIKHLIEEKFWNLNQEEIEANPFENTGGEIEVIGEDFNIQIKAHNWDEDEDGYLKFYFHNDLVVEFKWYKHCLRRLKVGYGNYEPEEAIELLDGCLDFYLEEIKEK